MKLSTQHLNSYFEKDYSTSELTTAIENAGIELEAVIVPDQLNNNIIVGLTKKVVQHPNADRLRVVLVDVGEQSPLQIVCGAPNVAEDQKVAVAMVGAVLPGDFEIKEAKLRGEVSQGMLCSESELGWSDNHDGIVVLPEDYQVGKSLCDIVSNDEILDIKTAANRSDLQSYEGVAREIAAQLGVKLLLPKVGLNVAANSKLIKKSDNKALAVGLVRMDVRHVGEAPAEVRRVLRAAGIREISPVVDVTNYVNLTVGQPTHAFDAAMIALPLHVRAAVRGEVVTTLNGKKNHMTIDDLVVADKNGAIDIAGVMGGLETEVSASTEEIVLIASTLDAQAVRKTAQRHGIRTDASARYERGLPVELADRGRAMVVALLVEMGAKLLDGARQGAIESPKRVIEVKPARICELLGVVVAPKDMVKQLTSLGFTVAGLAKLKITVPWWRPDVVTAADIAEEVIKMVGLEALPATIPSWSPQAVHFDSDRAVRDTVRGLLRAAGLFELTTYSFVSEADLQRFGMKPSNHLKLKNPLSSEQAYMRSTLLPSLVTVLERNQQYAKEFGVSEISRVFRRSAKKSNLPEEAYHVAIARFGDYYATKAVLDLLARELYLGLEFVPSKHAQYFPGRQADVRLRGEAIGSTGELHPRLLGEVKTMRSVSYAELQLAPIIAAAGAHVFAPISRFPTISRDVAVVVAADVLWSAVDAVIREELPTAQISFLSRYEGKGVPTGKVSLAFRMTLSNMERTLTDDEADKAVSEVVAALINRFNASLRS